MPKISDEKRADQDVYRRWEEKIKISQENMPDATPVRLKHSTTSPDFQRSRTVFGLWRMARCSRVTLWRQGSSSKRNLQNLALILTD